MNALDICKHWHDVRNGLLAALDKLTDSQLGFTPHEGLWSLHQTAVHIASAEEGWFHHVMTHELSGWDEADFQVADYPTLIDVKKLLAEVHTRVEAMFTQDADARMRQPVILPWGPTITLEEIVWHVLEHEIHHRGEIYLMLGMMDIEAPDV
jgi:uncharacterized damage-inducible protein DinB